MSEQIFVMKFDPAKVLEGLDELRKPQTFVPAMGDIGREVTGNLKKYPPTRPNQRYRRTGTLGRKWAFTTRVNLFGVTAVIGNNTPYARAVQDEDEQSWFHQGRWRTVQDELVAAKEYAPAIVQEGLVKRMAELFGQGD